MSKSKKFKLQISLEFFIGFSTLLSLFFIFIYFYFDSYKKYSEMLEYFFLESECYYISSKFNSFLPIILKNITYVEEFFIDLPNEIKIENYRIFLDNVSCYTKIESVNGSLKSGKNTIIIENGKISIV
ncbi:MAG: hypothetical protein QXL97_01930 [Candidatus Aenigmatarchaeota archaeon]